MRAIIPYILAALAAAIVVTLVREAATEIQGNTVISIYTTKSRLQLVIEGTLMRAAVLLALAGPVWALIRSRRSSTLGIFAARKPILLGEALLGLAGIAFAVIQLMAREELHLWVRTSPYNFAAVVFGWMLAGAAWGGVFKLAGRGQPSNPAAAAG
jgi:hypothetical protein